MIFFQPQRSFFFSTIRKKAQKMRKLPVINSRDFFELVIYKLKGRKPRTQPQGRAETRGVYQRLNYHQSDVMGKEQEKFTHNDSFNENLSK
ncbi:hypothetical protein CEXT_593131 [Caerostris extrusa]|uniref:Uncharacterized protein n=1 Tax=Caerostris extrusa TaxID=172846 RepID=A0AAV4P6K9_CAEEX|nr:hypothetical protein CEXT_593131 [Caerostris extrusa]